MPNPIVTIYISGHFPLSNNKPQNLSQVFKVFNNAKKNRGYVYVGFYILCCNSGYRIFGPQLSKCINPNHHCRGHTWPTSTPDARKIKYCSTQFKFFLRVGSILTVGIYGPHEVVGIRVNMFSGRPVFS